MPDYETEVRRQSSRPLNPQERKETRYGNERRRNSQIFWQQVRYYGTAIAGAVTTAVAIAKIYELFK